VEGVEMITQPMVYPTIKMTVEGVAFLRPAILEK
jgi:hypothetical protein